MLTTWPLKPFIRRPGFFSWFYYQASTLFPVLMMSLHGFLTCKMENLAFTVFKHTETVKFKSQSLTMKAYNRARPGLLSALWAPQTHVEWSFLMCWQSSVLSISGLTVCSCPWHLAVPVWVVAGAVPVFGSAVQHVHHPKGLCCQLGGWTVHAEPRHMDVVLSCGCCFSWGESKKEGITLPLVLVGNTGTVWEAQSSLWRRRGSMK